MNKVLTDNKILNAIKSFKGLPHRMEFILEKNQIKFFNDSKATNIEAASKSISCLNNIYLIAGGILKSHDISPIKPYLKRIKNIYFFGKDKEILAKLFDNLAYYEICNNIRDALNFAIKDTSKDPYIVKTILLSPMCSSFDQFKNFEDRGNYFKKLVKNLSA